MRGLGITMIACGITGIMTGLAFIFIPRQLGDILGFAKGPDFLSVLCAMLGASFISSSVFLIAAGKDPLRHISWARSAIVLALLMMSVLLYSFLRGLIDVRQAAMVVSMHAVFAIALLVFYPWRGRAKKEDSLPPRDHQAVLHRLNLRRRPGHSNRHRMICE